MAALVDGTKKSLDFQGASYLRQRLVFSLLSSRPVRFRDIRSADDEPGLRDYEISFLRLLDKITNGTKLTINETGTSLSFTPGVIVNGRKLSHDCATSRGIGYYLEYLVMLAAFGKTNLHITLRGVTNVETDPSVDVIRTVTLPLLKRFGIEDGLELKVTKRGCAPEGGGEVVFQCPNTRMVTPMDPAYLDVGKIKRIRGLAYTARVPPQIASRVVDACRVELNKFIPDVYIYTDHYSGEDAGKSPGFGLSLVAETTTGNLLSAEVVANKGELPEDLGQRCAKMLFEEVYRGGSIDTQSQTTALLFMVLGPEDVSKVRVGKLSSYSVQFLRDIRDFFGTVFKIRSDPDTKTTLLTCVGIGYTNVNKKIG